jgi:hypothetical protein
MFKNKALLASWIGCCIPLGRDALISIEECPEDIYQLYLEDMDRGSRKKR